MADFIMKIGKNSEKLGDTAVSGKGTAVTFSTDRDVNIGDSKSGGFKTVNAADDTVAVRDYVSGSGYDSIVDWDGESVTIGGIRIKPERIVNGTAYASRAAVDDALSSVKKRNGILGTEKIRDMYEKKYGRDIEAALSRLLSREPFSYSPESDASYKAYERQYMAAAEDAYRRVLNDNNTSVYGASGAVLSEAVAARSEQLKKLTDMIPQLEQNAYKRYADEGERMADNLKSLTDTAQSYYKRLYDADKDAQNALINAGRAEHKEEQRWIDNDAADRAAALSERAEERAGINDAYLNALRDLQAQKSREELRYYPQLLAEELAAARLKNSYAANEVSHAYDIAYAKAKAAINAKLGL